jgi:V/A-type H+-transporting ATPase subunit I
MVAALGVMSVIFGALYGEFFGPTKLLPTLWLDPLDSPTRLLVFAMLLGGTLLAGSHVLGSVNRWREGGPRAALTDPSALPGLVLLVGAGLVALAVAAKIDALEVPGIALVMVSMLMLASGLRSEAGRGIAAVGVVAMGLLDAGLRLFSNVFSFARLGAFGLMHAAVGLVVIHAAGGLTGTPAGNLAAGVVFLAGWTVALALEGLVVAVQALRLEYYELFSRVFAREGLAFRPWSLQLLSTEEGR